MYSFVFIFTFCFSLAVFTAVIADHDEVSRQTLRCRYDYFRTWTFRKDLWNGPDHWGDIYDQCHGFNQSPINIDTSRISQDEHPHWAVFIYPFVMEYPTYINDGHAISVIPGDQHLRFIYINYTRYDFQEAHFHFGCSKCCGNGGSEHSIDGQSYAMEMHLIHRNADTNKTLVAAIFFKEVCGETNGELCHITNAAKKILHAGMNTTSAQRLDLRNLVPDIAATYYQYEGSLTTPECEEGVTWAIVETPVIVGCHQMEILRGMYSSPQQYSEAGCKLCGNSRPQQPLHRRKVYRSWTFW